MPPAERFVAKTVAILSDGKFYSGEDLARQLGVTRATVWNAIDTAKKLGLDIFAVRGKGYRLAYPVELYDKQVIQQWLSPLAKDVLTHIDIHWQIDSTNRFLLDTAAREESNVESSDTGKLRQHRSQVCLAEMQTQGRGRRGRTWVSPLGGNIYMSLMWRFGTGPSQLSGLSLATAVAVVRALHKLEVRDIGLKWPNDIVHRKGKLAGILLEMSGEAAGPCTVVAGVGLNIKLAASPAAEIDQPWVDLSSISDKPLQRNRLVAEIISEVTAAYCTFEQLGLAGFLQDWQKWDYYDGRHVMLQLPNETIDGVVRGVDTDGALKLAKDGKLVKYHSGEVSLRLLGAWRT